MQGIVLAVRHIALAALLLRALVPAGWMPAQSQAGTSFVICSVNGPAQPAREGQNQPGDVSHHQPCAFAAAPHLGGVPDMAMAVPALPIFAAARAGIAPVAPSSAPYRVQSARAPPVSA